MERTIVVVYFSAAGFAGVGMSERVHKPSVFAALRADGHSTSPDSSIFSVAMRKTSALFPSPEVHSGPKIATPPICAVLEFSFGARVLLPPRPLLVLRLLPLVALRQHLDFHRRAPPAAVCAAASHTLRSLP